MEGATHEAGCWRWWSHRFTRPAFGLQHWFSGSGRRPGHLALGTGHLALGTWFLARGS